MFGTPVLKVANNVYNECLLPHTKMYKEFTFPASDKVIINVIINFAKVCERRKSVVKELFHNIYGIDATLARIFDI